MTEQVVVADFDDKTLHSVAYSLAGDGYDVSARHVDVGSAESVRALADEAASAGTVTQVVHTAGLSPTQASAETILRVDLYGAALVVEEFGRVIASGGAGVVIASIAGHLIGDLPAEQENFSRRRRSTNFSGCRSCKPRRWPIPASPTRLPSGPIGYASRGKPPLGERGARLNSISPGVIATPMGRQELEGDSGQHMRAMIDASATRRTGTPADIANAAAFLLGS